MTLFATLLKYISRIPLQEMFEEIKGLIRSRNFKMKMDNMTYNDLQNITSTQDRATRIPLKTGGELKFACGSQGKSL